MACPYTHHSSFKGQVNKKLKMNLPSHPCTDHDDQLNRQPTLSVYSTTVGGLAMIIMACHFPAPTESLLAALAQPVVTFFVVVVVFWSVFVLFCYKFLLFSVVFFSFSFLSFFFVLFLFCFASSYFVVLSYFVLSYSFFKIFFFLFFSLMKGISASHTVPLVPRL